MPSSPRGQGYGTLPPPDDAGKSRSLTGSVKTSIESSIKSKVSLCDYLWHQHSVLGITVPDDEVTHAMISAGPCCCCEVDPSGLTRRRRLLLFFLVFFVICTLAVEVSFGEHGWFYELCVTVMIVLPLVCHLNSSLPAYSRWLMSKGIGPILGVRIEELALVALYVTGLAKLWDAHHDMGIKALDGVLLVWLQTVILEGFSLVFLYHCGKYCCCCFNCLVPTTYELHGDEEDGDGDGDAANTGGV